MLHSHRYHSLFYCVLAVLFTTGCATRVSGAPTPGGNVDERITVAVLDFESKVAGQPELGTQIADVLSAVLTGDSNFRMVDRTELRQTLREHALNLTGLVESDQAIKIGKLAGAKILITGRAFPVGEKIFVSAKLIGTETSLVEGVLIKSDPKTAVDELVMQLAQEVQSQLQKNGAKLVAAPERPDPAIALQKKLADLPQKPVVGVFVSERHMTPARVPDPAVESEIKLMLQQAGFTVMDLPTNELSAWASSGGNWNQPETWPRNLTRVDLVITGQAFSELGARIGNLSSCSARGEINVISRKDGQVVLAQRATTRGVDLSDNIAAKTALQKAGHELGVHVLTYFANSLPAATPATQPASQ